jgi:hypothetical protein
MSTFITRRKFGTTATGKTTTRVTALLLLVTAVLVAALAGPFLSTASAESAGCTHRRPPFKCTVIEPNVRQSQTEYPQIDFEPGDQVLVEAGGCVNIGGNGRRMKRYVDPASDSDLYHGLIHIPGVTPGMERFPAFLNRTFTVPVAGILTLGYEDNGYDDNGYTHSDDGTANQCNGVGSAFVRLTITPAA